MCSTSTLASAWHCPADDQQLLLSCLCRAWRMGATTKRRRYRRHSEAHCCGGWWCGSARNASRSSCSAPAWPGGSRLAAMCPSARSATVFRRPAAARSPARSEAGAGGAPRIAGVQCLTCVGLPVGSFPSRQARRPASAPTGVASGGYGQDGQDTDAKGSPAVRRWGVPDLWPSGTSGAVRSPPFGEALRRCRPGICQTADGGVASFRIGLGLACALCPGIATYANTPEGSQTWPCATK